MVVGRIGVKVEWVEEKVEKKMELSDFVYFFFFFFKQKTAYEIGTGDWSSDVCSSDLSPSRTRCSSTASKTIGSINSSVMSAAYFSATASDRKSVV